MCVELLIMFNINDSAPTRYREICIRFEQLSRPKCGLLARGRVSVKAASPALTAPTRSAEEEE